MGLYESRGILSKAITQIERQWIEARTNWDDSRTKDFEERFLVPLRTDLKQAVGAMDSAATLLSKIRSECS